MRKILTVFLILSLAGSATAYEVLIDEDSARYNAELESRIDGEDAIVNVQAGDPAPESLYICSTELSLEEDTGFDGYYRFSDGSQGIPEDIRCSVGPKDVVIVGQDGSNQVLENEVFIDSFEMDPFIGKYLYVNMEADPARLEDFYLSNDTWGDVGRPNPEAVHPDLDSAWVMVNEPDAIKKDDSAAYEASVGNVLTPSSQNLAELIDDVPSAGNHEPGDTITTDTGGNQGACDEGPCDIVNNIEIGDDSIDTPYSSVDIEYDPDNFLPGSVTSAHAETPDGTYRPEGEIIVGNFPDHANGGPRENGPYFFMCTKGATMDNGFGEEVPQVVDIGGEDTEDLYKCDQSAEEWDQVSQCDTGLDHDGDDRIDYESSSNPDTDANSLYHREDLGSQEPDTDCGSVSDNEESVECSGVRNMTLNIDYGGVTVEDDVLIADYPQSGGSCTTDVLTEGVSTIQSDDDRLHRNWVSAPDVYTLDCNTSPLGICNNGVVETYNGDRVEVVDYYANASYFEALAEAQDKDLSSETVNTEFVDDSGWIIQSQTLIEAENKYTPESAPSGEEFSLDTWDGRITANVTYGGTEQRAVDVSYSDGKSINQEHLQSWVPSNAVSGSQFVSNTDAESESELFKGGWAGKCDTGSIWQYVNEPGSNQFECSGDLGLDQAALLFEDEANTVGNEGEIGLAIMPEVVGTTTPSYLPSEWSPYQSIVFDETNWPSGDSLQSLNARCWPGAESDESSRVSNGNYIEATGVSVNSDTPFGIYGNVTFPDSMSDENFACSWEFETQEDISYIPGVPSSKFTGASGVIRGQGDLVEIHNEASTPVAQNLTEVHVPSDLGGPQTFTSNGFTEITQVDWSEGLVEANSP